MKDKKKGVNIISVIVGICAFIVLIFIICTIMFMSAMIGIYDTLKKADECKEVNITQLKECKENTEKETKE